MKRPEGRDPTITPTDLRIVLRSKIHRAFVTSTDPDYIGSIFIDRDLMDKVDLWENEKVLICDVDNGNRWETYVLPADRGSGRVSVQGAGARLCEPGHCLIILSFGLTARPIQPKMILVDRKNAFVEYLESGVDGPVHIPGH